MAVMQGAGDARPRRVLVVDDSSMIRKAIRRIFEDSDALTVVGEAANGVEALELIPQVEPDVVTLDINMPVMDGLTTLKHMMIKSPRPTVMVSTLTREGASITFDALKYGAVDFVPKPSQFNPQKISEQRENLVRKVMLASGVEMGAVRYMRPSGKAGAGEAKKRAELRRVFVLGASEGGYSTLLKIVPLLRPDLAAAVLAVVYVEPSHVESFAAYLNEHSFVEVKKAEDKEPLSGGVCYLASGDEYLGVEKKGDGHSLRVVPGPPAGRKTSIDALFVSAAENFGDKAVGIVLSGSGRDGTEGLKQIMGRGGIGVAQHPRTCLCKEMALFALKELKVHHIVPDREIASRINQFFQ